MPDREDLVPQDPITGSRVNAARATYADDLATAVLCDTASVLEREVYTSSTKLEGRVVPKAKYLGEMFSYNWSATPARQHRLGKAQAAWDSVGQYWTSGSSRKSVCVVLRGACF